MSRLDNTPADTIRQQIVDLDEEIKSVTAQIDTRTDELDLLHDRYGTLGAKRRSHIAALDVLEVDE